MSFLPSLRPSRATLGVINHQLATLRERVRLLLHLGPPGPVQWTSERRIWTHVARLVPDLHRLRHHHLQLDRDPVALHEDLR